jgi:hypothetical protein
VGDFFGTVRAARRVPIASRKKLKKVLDTKQSSDIIGDMKAVVTIQMDNQAFEQPYTCMELEKILYKIADTVGRQAIDSVGHECAEADANGNYIAKLKIVED